MFQKFLRKPRDFPGGPGVKTSPSGVESVGSIPDQGAKVTHASRPKNVKQKHYYNRFKKDFKKWSTLKKKKNLKQKKAHVSDLTHWIYKLCI